jgi:hypothetical protein
VILLADLRGGSTVGGRPILSKEARDNYLGKIVGNKVKESLIYDNGTSLEINGNIEVIGQFIGQYTDGKLFKLGAGSTDVFISNAKSSAYLQLKDDGTLRYNDNEVWHAGNDGAGSGLDADLLDGMHHTYFMRSNADDSFSGKHVASARRAGIYGTYDSYKIDHIWSMGSAYMVESSGADFGNLYGLAYKHTNNTTGGTMAGGHQMVWCHSGVPKSAVGEGLWTSGDVNAGGSVNATNLRAYSSLTTENIKLSMGGYEFDAVTPIVSSSTGNGMKVGSGGILIVGSGESADYTANYLVGNNSEHTFITSDNDIRFGAGMNDGYTTAKMWILDSNGHLQTPNYNNSGIKLDENGNFDAPSTTTSGAYWNVQDHAGNVRVMIPLHSTAYTTGSMPIQLGEFKFWSGRGTDPDGSDSQILAFRQYTSTNIEYIVHDDATNGWYFNADQGLPPAGGHGTGNGQLYAAKYNVVSDKNQKENISEFRESALDKVKLSKTYTYDHIMTDLKKDRLAKKGVKNKKSMGLIAQEAPTDILTQEGNGIDLYAMNTMLWKAVQELADENDTLKLRLDDLEKSRKGVR